MHPESIHLFHHSFTRGGGMERYALTLASALKAPGRSLVFHVRKSDPGLAQRLDVELDVHPVARFPRKLQDFRFFRQVDRIRPSFDGLQIALTRVRARDAVICGGTHRGYLKRARKVAGPFDWLQVWMETQAYRAARVIIAHSDLCAREMAQLYSVPTDKIVTLYPPVSGAFAPADATQRAEFRKRFGLPTDKLVFLFPSMGHSRKGFKPVRKALASFSDRLVLAVAGKPPAGSSGEFVRYLGYIEDMASAYRSADFTILGSLYEPFGLVGPESILCGTRLVFEENVGCLAAVKPEFVTTFSVWDLDSIRQAADHAMNLAAADRHRVTDPLAALRYDPSPESHVGALLKAVSSRFLTDKTSKSQIHSSPS